MLRKITLTGIIAATVLAGSIAAQQPQAASAKAELKDAKGKAVGTATLTGTPQGVLLRVEASGLTPGDHGLHVHEAGSCQPPDFKSAGGHFNPTTRKHGFRQPDGHHAGDVTNLAVAKDGTARAEFFLEGVQLEGSGTSLLRQGGTAVVIHAKPDDYRTDPAGDSGDRIACGVIQKQ